MSVTIAEIEGGKCDCREDVDTIYVDLIDCEGMGLTLKQYDMSTTKVTKDDAWIDLTPRMVGELITALTAWLDGG